MIELPRAAVMADRIAEVADFFSFGTNDLTQTTFGFSRDDIESKFLPRYLERKILPRNPFETVDDGVAKLVEMGCRAGRETNPGIKLGVCGEHGGDPDSVKVFHEIGLDYVSCSPYRVPLARLAAAQAALAEQACCVREQVTFEPGRASGPASHAPPREVRGERHEALPGTGVAADTGSLAHAAPLVAAVPHLRCARPGLAHRCPSFVPPWSSLTGGENFGRGVGALLDVLADGPISLVLVPAVLAGCSNRCWLQARYWPVTAGCPGRSVRWACGSSGCCRGPVSVGATVPMNGYHHA
jgi:hypothetical protein